MKKRKKENRKKKMKRKKKKRRRKKKKRKKKKRMLPGFILVQLHFSAFGKTYLIPNRSRYAFHEGIREGYSSTHS